MKKLTFRICRVDGGFEGWAWSDKPHSVCLRTPTFATYAEARRELGYAVNKHAPGFKLHWFDGEYDMRPGYATDGTKVGQ